MKATIREIAARAGVSPATVSMALNQKPGISQETRELVQEIAALLNYSKKPDNRLSANRATVRFTMITKHGHILNPNHKTFIADYIDGLEEEASKAGIPLEIFKSESFDAEKIIESLEDTAIAGTIILGTELDDADILSLARCRKPIVFLDTYNEAMDFDFVDMNNEASVHSIVNTLAAMGHTRIGIVRGSIETRNFRLREAAFRQALAELNIPFRNEDAFTIDSTYDQGYLDMQNALAHHPSLPTALFCVNDIIAYSCIAALSDAGHKVPESVSVVGFDDLPASEFTLPALSTVNVPKILVGRRAMQLLLARMDDPGKTSEKILVGGKLVIRQSVKDMRTGVIPGK